MAVASTVSIPFVANIYIVLIMFSEKNTIFLRESCQIVQPLAPDQIPVEAKENNYGLSNPGSIQAYLQVVDLMADKLRYASISLISINIFSFILLGRGTIMGVERLLLLGPFYYIALYLGI